jgi:hypothetical protein
MYVFIPIFSSHSLLLYFPFILFSYPFLPFCLLSFPHIYSSHPFLLSCLCNPFLASFTPIMSSSNPFLSSFPAILSLKSFLPSFSPILSYHPFLHAFPDFSLSIPHFISHKTFFLPITPITCMSCRSIMALP